MTEGRNQVVLVMSSFLTRTVFAHGAKTDGCIRVVPASG